MIHLPPGPSCPGGSCKNPYPCDPGTTRPGSFIKPLVGVILSAIGLDATPDPVNAGSDGATPNQMRRRTLQCDHPPYDGGRYCRDIKGRRPTTSDVCVTTPNTGPGRFKQQLYASPFRRSATLTPWARCSLDGTSKGGAESHRFIVPSRSLRSRSASSSSSAGNSNDMPSMAALSCTSSTKGRSLSSYSWKAAA